MLYNYVSELATPIFTSVYYNYARAIVVVKIGVSVWINLSKFLIAELSLYKQSMWKLHSDRITAASLLKNSLFDQVTFRNLNGIDFDLIVRNSQVNFSIHDFSSSWGFWPFSNLGYLQSQVI